MITKESGGSNFDLPEEVLNVLPQDPFEQLDVARKITSIALSTRVSALESESSNLRSKVAEKDSLIADLQSQIESLDVSLSDTADQLAQAHHEKEKLLKENESLSGTVKKLSRDVSKLEVFRKTLMQSLQEEEEGSARVPNIVANMPRILSVSSKSLAGDDDSTLPPSRYSSMQSQVSETEHSSTEDREPEASRPRISHLLLASQTSTPRLTPPVSPPSQSASVSPTRTSKPVSPRRHSISFSTSRGIYDDRSSVYSSMPSSHHGSMTGSDSGSQTGRTRVDGKEFFRRGGATLGQGGATAPGAELPLGKGGSYPRSRLSYEQFGAFLANVKELNSHKQTREETLRKADEIFGPDNKDLFTIFEGLITRNVH